MQGIVLIFRANTCLYLLIILLAYLIITVWHIRVCIYLSCHCMPRVSKIEKTNKIHTHTCLYRLIVCLYIS